MARYCSCVVACVTCAAHISQRQIIGESCSVLARTQVLANGNADAKQKCCSSHCSVVTCRCYLEDTALRLQYILEYPGAGTGSALPPVPPPTTPVRGLWPNKAALSVSQRAAFVRDERLAHVSPSGRMRLLQVTWRLCCKGMQCCRLSAHERPSSLGAHSELTRSSLTRPRLLPQEAMGRYPASLGRIWAGGAAWCSGCRRGVRAVGG